MRLEFEHLNISLTTVGVGPGPAYLEMSVSSPSSSIVLEKINPAEARTLAAALQSKAREAEIIDSIQRATPHD